MTSCRSGFAWVLNLDAEFELAAGPRYTPPSRLLAQLEQYGADACRLLGPNDVLVARPGRPQADPQVAVAVGHTLIGRAWCPTPRALAALHAVGVAIEAHPALPVIRRVNHRRFAFELGGGLESQRYVEDRDTLDAELRRATMPLLLKRPLTFAGRGQTRVYAHADITPKEWRWIEVSLESDGLIIEPLVTPTLEVSVHGFLWRGAHFELGHTCVQDVSERGVFRGVRRARPGELSRVEQRSLLAQAERVATALAGAGYFGPFGIDAFRYRVAEKSGFCALSEINARYTMGFVVGFPTPASELVL